MTFPGYWMHEASGTLAPAVRRYLEGVDLSDADVVLLRAYFRQWVEKGAWMGGVELRDLLDSLSAVVDRPGLSAWLSRALELGIDPL